MKGTENEKSMIKGLCRDLENLCVNGLIFKHSNGIYRPTVFEVRMRQIDLAVDHTMLLSSARQKTIVYTS